MLPYHHVAVLFYYSVCLVTRHGLSIVDICVYNTYVYYSEVFLPGLSNPCDRVCDMYRGTHTHLYMYIYRDVCWEYSPGNVT